MRSAPTISVIIPTYQRRELVLRVVDALDRQELDRPFEAIIVVDGSTDGTEEALRERSTSFSLHVIAHPNRGLARTRNRGAAAARGDILLFLDDDMEPHPRLLAEHLRSHMEGAEVVRGAIPLHPASPANLLSQGVGVWADGLHQRYSEPGYRPRFNEIITGQFSMRRRIFAELGGFDERFTRAGSYGNEDVDLGLRICEAGYRVVYNPNAISHQWYVVSAAVHLRQYRQAGQADVMMARKHPHLLRDIFAGEMAESRLHRIARLPTLYFPGLAGALSRPLARTAIRRVDAGHEDAFTARAFFLARAVEYWLGVHEAGGVPSRQQLRILCYHAIADLSDDAVLADYGVPADRFRAQLRTLRDAGYSFVAPDELQRFIGGAAGLPRKALLLTFDDCYTDLLDAALPVLQEEGIPAIAFAVSGRLGAHNDWDVAIGARPLPILDADGLRVLARHGIEIAAHSVTHLKLVLLSDAELAREVNDAATDLENDGIARPRFFSYPHGEHDVRVRRMVARAGYAAAFTVTPGICSAGTDPLQLPRLEILPRDVGRRLLRKVWLAGRTSRVWQRARQQARNVKRLMAARRTADTPGQSQDLRRSG